MEPRYEDYFNAYQIFGINPGVSLNEIKSAYRKKARATHPDKNRDNEKTAHENFTKLRNAYVLLCDEVTRKKFEEYYVTTRSAREEFKRSSDDDDELKRTYRREIRVRRTKREINRRSTLTHTKEHLYKIRKESLQVIKTYVNSLGSDFDSSGNEDRESRILKHILNTANFDEIVENFNQFERTILEKLKNISIP